MRYSSRKCGLRRELEQPRSGKAANTQRREGQPRRLHQVFRRQPESRQLLRIAAALRMTRAVLPNPSLEARPNGMPPGPAARYGVHFLSSGPGVLPLVPPQLKR